MRKRKRRKAALDSTEHAAGNVLDIAPMLEARAELRRTSAPPPSERVNFVLSDLRRVTEDELKPAALLTELRMIADLFRIAAERKGTDTRTRQVADVLIALGDRGFDPTSFARRAKIWNEAHFIGVEPRTRQANTFIETVARHDPAEIVHRLSALPDLLGAFVQR